MTSNTQKLRRRLKRELSKYRNPYHMAVANDWPSTLVYRCLEDGYSPTLYKLVYKRQHYKRLIIAADPTRYDTLRGDMSRADFIEALLDCWQGIAELRY